MLFHPQSNKIAQKKKRKKESTIRLVLPVSNNFTFKSYIDWIAAIAVNGGSFTSLLFLTQNSWSVCTHYSLKYIYFEREPRTSYSINVNKEL